ncbi:MAG TPA: hypothetical protein VGB51_00740 [Actinomycetota bacterium]
MSIDLSVRLGARTSSSRRRRREGTPRRLLRVRSALAGFPSATATPVAASSPPPPPEPEPRRRLRRRGRDPSPSVSASVVEGSASGRAAAALEPAWARDPLEALVVAALEAPDFARDAPDLERGARGFASPASPSVPDAFVSPAGVSPFWVSPDFAPPPLVLPAALRRRRGRRGVPSGEDGSRMSAEGSEPASLALSGFSRVVVRPDGRLLLRERVDALFGFVSLAGAGSPVAGTAPLASVALPSAPPVPPFSEPSAPPFGVLGRRDRPPRRPRRRERAGLSDASSPDAGRASGVSSFMQSCPFREH